MDFNNDFKYDLKVGQVGEKLLATILESKKIEVKKDLQALTTGNLFIEYESRNQPSGISKSEADFYAFVFISDSIILIGTEDLKIKCRKYIKTERDVVGGDNNTSKGILLPVSDLLS